MWERKGVLVTNCLKNWLFITWAILVNDKGCANCLLIENMITKFTLWICTQVTCVIP